MPNTKTMIPDVAILIEEKIHLTTLADVCQQELLECFNSSFKNYFVPLQLSLAQFQKKIVAEGIDIQLSIGMFNKNKLIGFILHALEERAGKRIVYNAGTGILPQYRGKQLAVPMYEFALTLLKKNDLGSSVLEVIDQNIPAIQLYKRNGFIISRQLDSFTCTSFPPGDNAHQIETISVADGMLLQSICEWQPAWQYSWNTLSRCADDYQVFVASEAAEYSAYCAVNVQTGRIAHFGCKQWSEHEQLLHCLFNHVAKKAGQPLSVIHVDHRARESKEFLKRNGFQPCLNCFEMELAL